MLAAFTGQNQPSTGMSVGRSGLFAAQGCERVDARGATGGKIGGEQGDAHKGHRVGGADAEQERGHRACEADISWVQLDAE